MWFVAHLERLSCRPTELDGVRWTSVTYSNESVGAGEKVVFYLPEQTPPINIGTISLVLLLQIIPQLNDALRP